MLFIFQKINLLLLFFVSFILCFISIKYFIKILKKYNKFQPIRLEGPEKHYSKAKTPTMGGIIMTGIILLNIILFCDLHSRYMWIVICLIIAFSAIGLLDDLMKIFYNDTIGFKGFKKLILQLLITSICILFLCYINIDYLKNSIYIPLFNINLYLGNFIPAFYLLMICGSSNATNITDGLDGLLALPIVLISITILIMVCMIFTGFTSTSIQIDNTLLHDLSIILVSIIATFGCFLIFNHHPAKIFMGDIGSLMIGSILAYISILLKIEILYAIMSLLFIIEIMSSVIQIVYFKYTHGKRIFKMAPLHHHLESSGWSEDRIVFSMWFFVFCCCIFSFLLFIYKYKTF